MASCGVEPTIQPRGKVRESSYEQCRSFAHAFRRFDASMLCPVCGTIEEAPVLVLDGTALSCQASRAIHPPPKNILPGAAQRGSYHRDRVFVNKPECRELLLAFVRFTSAKRKQPVDFSAQVRHSRPRQ